MWIVWCFMAVIILSSLAALLFYKPEKSSGMYVLPEAPVSEVEASAEPEEQPSKVAPTVEMASAELELEEAPEDESIALAVEESEEVAPEVFQSAVQAKGGKRNKQVRRKARLAKQEEEGIPKKRNRQSHGKAKTKKMSVSLTDVSGSEAGAILG